jgi:hypothetical protein
MKVREEDTVVISVLRIGVEKHSKKINQKIRKL